MLRQPVRRAPRLARFAPPVTEALRGISLSISKGETIALIGNSGCGKSTLGRVAAGLLVPDVGLVVYRFNGTVSSWPTASGAHDSLRQVRRCMRLVFQNPEASLNTSMRVSEILEEPIMTHTKEPRARRREMVEAAVPRFRLPCDCLGRRAGSLSGGEKKRLSLARALVVVPQIIMLDETLTGLDLPLQEYVLDVLREVQKETGATLLFITHDLRLISLILGFSDVRVVVMEAGRIREVAMLENLVQRVVRITRSSPTPSQISSRSGVTPWLRETFF